MSIACTLCKVPTQYNNTYIKVRTFEQDYRLPVGISQQAPKAEKGNLGRKNRIVLFEGVCDRCSMLVAGYIESLRE